ncbi:MAG: aminotransferase class IV [Pseudomonadota bacterium]
MQLSTTGSGETVYLNGLFLPANEARISPFDRGFLFAHAAYEVTAMYDGRLVDWPGHAARLARTLEGIALPVPVADLEALHIELADRNAMAEGLVYLQVTGGAYGFRDFAGPESLEPSVFMFVSPKALIGAAARDGIAAVSLPDTRWRRRDFKTTQLLSQALAYRTAKAAGAQTAFMHEDGTVTEAASANAWIVTAEGTLVTRDLSTDILHGITRAKALSLLNPADVSVEERSFSLEEVRGAREAFTTSAGAIIAPVIALDGAPIGDGKPGPVTRQVQRLYYEAMGADVASVAPWATP